MQVFDLKGEVRNDLGKKATKAVRYAEKVPCVLLYLTKVKFQGSDERYSIPPGDG